VTSSNDLNDEVAVKTQLIGLHRSGLSRLYMNNVLDLNANNDNLNNSKSYKKDGITAGRMAQD